jgi:hypothetical protein
VSAAIAHSLVFKVPPNPALQADWNPAPLLDSLSMLSPLSLWVTLSHGFQRLSALVRRTQSRSIQESCTSQRRLAFPIKGFWSPSSTAMPSRRSSPRRLAAWSPRTSQSCCGGTRERIPDRPRRSRKRSLARTVWHGRLTRDLSRTPCIRFTILVRDVSRGADVELRCGPRLRQGECLRGSQLHQDSAHRTRCEI